MVAKYRHLMKLLLITRNFNSSKGKIMYVYYLSLAIKGIK